MTNFISMIRTVLMCFLLPISAFAEINEWCPVKPHKKAKHDYALEYDGAKIYFCCASCVEDFEVSPKFYLKSLPEELRRRIGSDKIRMDSPLESAEKDADNILYLTKPYGLSKVTKIAITASGCFCLLMIGICFLLRKRASSRKIFLAFALVSGIFCPVLVLTADSWGARKALKRAQKKLDDKLVADNLHFASFYEFGNPLFTRNTKQQKSLKVIYYRGNDERSPKLFNNGFYRTCTFHIAATKIDGTPLEYEQALKSKEFRLQVKIVRAPKTPDHFFTPELMSKIFLTSNSDPYLGRAGAPADRVSFSMSEDNQVFEASFPISTEKKRILSQPIPTVYIREERYADDKLLGSRVHYSIHINLQRDEDGKILPSSDLWMGATYRTRRLRNWEIPESEWLGLEPIPELPGKHMTRDPNLLGTQEQEQNP